MRISVRGLILGTQITLSIWDDNYDYDDNDDNDDSNDDSFGV